MLGLLGLLAEERPVVVLVDDLHRLDIPSATADVFAARRLLADAVAVVAPVRRGSHRGRQGGPRGTLSWHGSRPRRHAALAKELKVFWIEMERRARR